MSLGDGVKGLLSSKKSLAGGLLVIGATVLTSLGKMSVTDWEAYTKWIFVAWAGAETLNGVAATIKGVDRKKAP